MAVSVTVLQIHVAAVALAGLLLLSGCASEPQGPFYPEPHYGYRSAPASPFVQQFDESMARARETNRRIEEGLERQREELNRDRVRLLTLLKRQTEIHQKLKTPLPDEEVAKLKKELASVEGDIVFATATVEIGEQSLKETSSGYQKLLEDESLGLERIGSRMDEMRKQDTLDEISRSLQNIDDQLRRRYRP